VPQTIDSGSDKDSWMKKRERVWQFPCFSQSKTVSSDFSILLLVLVAGQSAGEGQCGGKEVQQKDHNYSIHLVVLILFRD
jgi:hypothetical protein